MYLYNFSIDSLKFYTNLGKTHGPFGGNGGGLHTISGDNLKYVTGRSGSRIDQISFNFNKCE